MASYVDLPCSESSNIKRVFLSTDTIRVIEDTDGTVLVTDDGDQWYEVDLSYKSMKKLITQKGTIGVGRRVSNLQDKALNFKLI